MQDFIMRLSLQITRLDKYKLASDKSFADFLKLLDSESLNEYYLLAHSILDKNVSDETAFQKVLILYLLIISQLEKKSCKSIELDAELLWLLNMVGFLSSEMLQRQGLIQSYYGFLYDGKIQYTMK